MYKALENEVKRIEDDAKIWGAWLYAIKKEYEDRSTKKKETWRGAIITPPVWKQPNILLTERAYGKSHTKWVKSLEEKNIWEEICQADPDEHQMLLSSPMPPEETEMTFSPPEQEQDEVGVATDKDQNEKAKTQEEGTTLEQKNKKSMPAITEREQKYFDEAAKAGLLEKVGTNKYRWLYDRPKSQIVYFFIKAYEPASPPYKKLGALFGMTGLSKCAEGLKRRQWYIDELKREGKMERFRNEVLKEPPEWANGLRLFFENLEKNDD